MTKKIMILGLFVLLISGCALNEQGYGIRGGINANPLAQPDGTYTTATTKIDVDVIGQKLDSNTQAIRELAEAIKKPCTEKQSSTVERKLSADMFKKAARKVTKTKPKPVVKRAPCKTCPEDKDRIARLEMFQKINHPGQDMTNVNFHPGLSSLSQRDMDNLMTRVARPWFQGRIDILGIEGNTSGMKSSAGIADEDKATQRYIDTVAYLNKCGLPAEALKKLPGGKTTAWSHNDNAVVVIQHIKNPETIKKNKELRKKYNIGSL